MACSTPKIDALASLTRCLRLHPGSLVGAMDSYFSPPPPPLAFPRQPEPRHPVGAFGGVRAFGLGRVPVRPSASPVRPPGALPLPPVRLVGALVSSSPPPPALLAFARKPKPSNTMVRLRAFRLYGLGRITVRPSSSASAPRCTESP